MRTIEAVLGRPRVGHRVCRTVGPAVLVAEFVNLQTFTNPVAAVAPAALVAEFVNLQTFTNPVAAVAPAALVAEFVNLQTFTNPTCRPRRPRRRGQGWRPGVQLRTRNPTPSEFFPTWWWRGTHNRFLKRGWRENYICSCLECDGGRQTVPLSAGTRHNPGVSKFSVHTMLKPACPRKNRYHRHPECVTLLQLSPPTLWILRRADFYDARRIRPLHDVQVGHCFIYCKPYVKGRQAGRRRWME